MRINKFLAEKGIASRRHAVEMITAGRVKINGVTAMLGANVGVLVMALFQHGKQKTDG